MLNDVEKLLAVDVCGTLYQDNTTAGFVAQYVAQHGLSYLQYFAIAMCQRRHPVALFFVVLGKILGRDLHRITMVRLLRGASQDALRQTAIAYVDHLQHRKINPSHHLLEQLRKQGWQPLLVSNSIEPVIAEIATRMQLPYLCSQLDMPQQRCSGRIIHDLTGKKREAIEAMISTSLDDIAFAVMTDNQSDGDLLACANPAYVVASAGRRGWMQQYDAEIMDI